MFLHRTWSVVSRVVRTVSQTLTGNHEVSVIHLLTGLQSPQHTAFAPLQVRVNIWLGLLSLIAFEHMWAANHGQSRAFGSHWVFNHWMITPKGKASIKREGCLLIGVGVPQHRPGGVRV